MTNTDFDRELIYSKNPWLSRLIIVEETTSTQKELMNAVTGALCIAERQKAGYGRFRRSFFSSKAGGIYMSLKINPDDFKSPSEITLLSAAAIVSAIENLTDKSPLIKWVNDIYLNNKKVAGILVETGDYGLILGIGINFHVMDFPEDLLEQATSIFGPDDEITVTKSDLIAEIWSEFYRLKNENYFEIYRKHCFVLGKIVSFSQNNKSYEGTAFDLTNQGELIVSCTDGSEKILNSGEISIKVNLF